LPPFCAQVARGDKQFEALRGAVAGFRFRSSLKWDYRSLMGVARQWLAQVSLAPRAEPEF
jgi:hypothetical protein